METVTVAEGRRLADAEYGASDGAPVVCFHGIPGSRRIWELFDDPATRRGIRVVAPDHPGYGCSPFQPGRELLDWPADVHELTDRLDLDRFGVVGFSGGGPHALACAHALPERVDGTVLVSAVAPPAILAALS